MKGECGHEVTFIIGRFALCSLPGCDTKPDKNRCRKCASRDLYPFVGPFVPPDTVACRACGAVRWSVVSE